VRDVLGWRRKFGAIGPSTNTVVQYDYDAMRPIGVTNHHSRIFTPNAKLTNETFRAGPCGASRRRNRISVEGQVTWTKLRRECRLRIESGHSDHQTNHGCSPTSTLGAPVVKSMC
jgi:hypothetical protein